MKKVLIFVASLFLPVAAFAQNSQVVNTGNLNTAIRNLTGTVNLLVPFFLAIAVVVFIYGVIRYIIAAGPEGKENARSYIIYGVIGIAAILAVWGLARLLIDAFGLRPTQLDPSLIPSVPIQ